MSPLHRTPWARQAAALLGVLILLLFVNNSINAVRAPAVSQFPGPGDSLWRTNPNQALAISRNWLDSGLAINKYMMHFMKPKVENPAAGSPYVSYPPGFALFPYAVAKLLGSTLEVEHLTLWGALCHFACAALAALTVFFVTMRWGAHILAAASIAGMVGSVALLMPYAVAFFPFAWWADILVLPFFFAVVAAEMLLPRNSRWSRGVQIALIALGVLTDWLFFLLAFCLVLKDLSSRPRRIRPENILLPGLYIAWHVWMVWNAGMMPALIAKFEVRTGMKNQEFNLSQGLDFWWANMIDGMGKAGAILGLAVLALTPVLTVLFFLRHRLAARLPALFQPWIEASFLLCAPVLLHFILLHQHYYEHPYEVLKFTVLVPLFWLGLVPAPAFAFARHAVFQVALVLLLLAASWGLSNEYPAKSAFQFRGLFDVDASLQRRCLEVYRNSVYQDISVSPDFGTVGPPPLNTSKPEHPKATSWAYVICNRHLYYSPTPKDVKTYYVTMNWKEILGKTPFNLKLWTAGKPTKDWEKFVVPGTGRQTGELWVHELSLDILK